MQQSIIRSKQLYDLKFTHYRVLSKCFDKRPSKKPLLFKSFTGHTVQQFDDIFDKKIAKRYAKY